MDKGLKRRVENKIRGGREHERQRNEIKFFRFQRLGHRILSFREQGRRRSVARPALVGHFDEAEQQQYNDTITGRKNEKCIPQFVLPDERFNQRGKYDRGEPERAYADARRQTTILGERFLRRGYDRVIPEPNAKTPTTPYVT